LPSQPGSELGTAQPQLVLPFVHALYNFVEKVLISMFPINCNTNRKSLKAEIISREAEMSCSLQYTKSFLEVQMKLWKQYIILDREIYLSLQGS
jgi:hypothetical protein